jgi:hypothetical protein
MMQALNSQYCDVRHKPCVHIPDVMWLALRSIVDFSHVRTCLVPAAREPVPAQLLELGLRCFVNSVSLCFKAHTRFDPFGAQLHEFFATGDGTDSYFVHMHPDLLDLMLPLALQHANTVVIAAVPVAYMESDLPHRTSYFLDNIWSKGRGVFVRIVLPSGHQSPLGWLLLFPDVERRELVLQGRVAQHSCELLWDSRHPRSLVFLRGLHLLHLDLVRQQGVQAISRWLQVLARRGGVSISQLPPHTPDIPFSMLKQLHLAPHS